MVGVGMMVESDFSVKLWLRPSGTIRYSLSESGVPPNIWLFGGTVPPNSVLFGGTVPPNSFPLKSYLTNPPPTRLLDFFGF